MTENDDVQSAPINQLALWSMIAGIAGWVFYFTPTPAPLVAIVLGHIALVKNKRQPGRNRAFAIAGLVLGYSGVVIAALAILAAIALTLPMLGAIFGGVIVP